VFFRAENLSEAINYLNRMFIYHEGNISTNNFVAYFNFNYELIITTIIALIFSMPVYPYLENKFKNPKLLAIRYLSIITLLLISIIYVAADSYNPFIYFRF